MAGHPPRTGDREHDPLRTVLRTLASGDLRDIALYVALSLAAALAGGVAALSLVPLIQPGHPLPFADAVLHARGARAQAVIFGGITALFALLRWWTARLGARLVSRYGLRLRWQVHARLTGASLAALADSTSAEIANVLTYNVDIAIQGLSALLQLLVASLTCVASLGLALWVSPPLVLAAPVLAGIGLATSRLFAREQAEVSRGYIADMTRLFWHSEDFPRRLRHVRSFGREDAERASYADVAARLCEGYGRQLELVASGRLVLEWLAAAGIAAIFVLAEHWHGVDQASLIAVCLLLGRLLPYLVSTRQSFQQLRSAIPAIALWQRYMRLADADGPTPMVRPPADGALHIAYLRVTPPTVGLEVRDLRLAPGEMTLVSGHSGIGKSSLVDVLAGMASPQAFAARVGGKAIDFAAYREQVRHGAYVSQSVRPWQRTVRECLLWAAPDASEEALRQAVTDVGLDKRLANSPEGLDTELHGSASRLSGGELQRLLLAQVILRQPRLAVLDEATSALDPAAESKVLAALRRRLPRTILVVVAHRREVAALADQWLVIDGDGPSVIHAGGTMHADLA
ncbi:ATP-binding cassette domain-containing protein [Dyella sedimenti]|uniref:ATP-binding cassette domain-containing protein n=1 Tax=Dyella sedimenti TaxID=2919947 RepID=UPI001FAADFCF|nr:ABC transporter ATP-binding protein [Dyella sedimenti]